MRCNQAIISAFVVHPQYRKYIASPHLLDLAGIEAARYAPPEMARAIIQLHVDKLVAQQSRTGLWKPRSGGRKEHAPAVSYRVLSAIRQADMLPEIGSDSLPFRYDPFPPLADREDHYGVLVRRMFGRALPGDTALARKLIEGISAKQEANGSWADTIMNTALAMEHLLELGLTPDAPAITQGTLWLLAQYRERIERRGVFAQDLFCSEDPNAEFVSAEQEIPETIPRFACYGLLSLIPTGLALRLLVTTGHADDPRVEASYISLLKLAGLTFNQDGTTLGSIGGWCSHGCMALLENEAKARRKRA